MGKKYKTLLTTIITALILTGGIGFSYCLYQMKINDINNYSLVETDEYISINYLDGKSFDIKDFKNGDTYTKRVSITNVGNSDTYVTLSLMDVDKYSDDLSLIVMDSDKKEIYNKKITNIDTVLVKSVDLAVGKTLSYTVMIKNDGSETKFSANILAFKEIIKKENTNFKDTILSNNSVIDMNENVGKQVANTAEGLIKTMDDDGEAYFFRGNVENNNVTFNNLNWKIVRINGNSSVRLILDGALENQIVYNDNADEVEDYTTKLVYEKSKIKEELDSWLSINFQEYSKFITDSIFCEDTSILKEENNILYLNPYNRVFVDNIPTLTCMGNKIKEKVGILTADEVVLAGAYQKQNNYNYYLFNGNLSSSWWTLSGSQVLKNNNVVDAISVNKDGSLSYDKKISNAMFVRPVISLDSNTIVSGTGTKADPYIVKVS